MHNRPSNQILPHNDTPFCLCKPEEIMNTHQTRHENSAEKKGISTQHLGQEITLLLFSGTEFVHLIEFLVCAFVFVRLFVCLFFVSYVIL